MKIKDFFNLFGKSFISLIKNPLLVLPGIFLWFFFLLINKLGLKIAPLLTNTFTNVVWVLIVTLVTFTAISFIFGGAINLSSNAIKETKKNFFSSAKKNLLSNFSILIFVFLTYNLLVIGTQFLFTKLMLYLAQYFIMPDLIFKLMLFLIGAFWICTVLLFLIYSNFFAVIKNQKAREAVKSSINFTKYHYLETLTLSVITFITFFLLSKIPPKFGGIIDYLIIIPFYTLLITRFILENDIRTK